MSTRPREVFSSCHVPGLQPEKLNDAISEFKKEASADGDGGKVWLCLDDRVLVKDCGHYLLYGSESLCGIAARLSNEYKDYRQVLVGRGTPTIFCCKVPIEYINDWVFDELCGDLLEEIFIYLLESERPFNHLGFSFSLSRNIEPKYIESYYHPEEIRDPLTMQLYRLGLNN